MIEDLRGIVKGEISIEEEELKNKSRDASIFEVKPEAVVYPKDVEDLKNIVSWASECKAENPNLSLTARSAGTDMTGGPLNDSVILDFTRYFNRVGEVTAIPPDGGIAVVEPGVYYRDFEKETLAKNLLMPSYPASREICTVGGMAANNSGGEKSLRFGQTVRYVEELAVVLSDGNEYTLHGLDQNELAQKISQQDFEGEVYRRMRGLIEDNYDVILSAKPDVTKNSAGYLLWDVWPNRETFNLAKLFVGSQGTLGLITKIKFRLIRPKKYSKLLVIFLNDLAPLGELVKEVVKFKPESFEAFDDQALKLAVKFLPDIMKNIKTGAFSLALKFLPELGMMIMGGVPELVLIAEFTGETESEADDKLKMAEPAVKKKFPSLKTHITRSLEEAEKYWIMRRESFNLLRHHVQGKHTAPFIDDVIVHVDQLPEFLPRLKDLIGQYPGLTYTVAGHAGDANFHVIPLMDFSDEANQRIIPELSEKVYDLVVSMKGSITAEHNDGLIRTPYLEKMYGPKICELFRQTKEIFDPLNIFNPRKKVLPDKDFARTHIAKTNG
ncbi:MAG: Oxidoreductase [Parcubacteria group bacterium GW2011_GWA1_49_11]|uniref:D-lactate dehydrogenase (cytochrome) n=1 Tax=Candidatus Yanofskybacteria bacterium RIFCSPHIGHO2_01_FULL_48_25b TaxID=1802672 RepID=A0A1F8F2X8_9BACT|nr:MAG: Oxidoreductase [Parcubacteria group bacterium GW2011_GWA1_49_11]OGN07483.1 MAG: hypothetical protein A2669_02080 [Candidatus Yanofskybacteria bacterium RIFCSPHIGHO2_01_FULL_48_25b]